MIKKKDFVQTDRFNIRNEKLNKDYNKKSHKKYKSWPNLYDKKYFINDEDNLEDMENIMESFIFMKNLSVRKELKNQSIQTDYITKINTNSSCDDLISGFEHEEEKEINNNISKLKKDGFILKHQLTRDSGIDTDNHQISSSNISCRAQQIFSTTNKKSNEDEYIEKPSEIYHPIKSLNTTIKSNTKRPSSLTIKTTTDIKNQYISFTRDNSIDEIENSEHDDIMVNLFNRNVVDEDEMSDNVKLEESETDYYKLSTNEEEFNMKSISNSNSSYDIASNKRKIFKGKF